MSKASHLLAAANEMAAKVQTWADLSNALFDPEVGLVARAYPTRDERAEFLRSPEYQKIRELIDNAVARSGLVDGATPQKSGKFVVRLPKSLHAALEDEAKREGVSLNQLVVAKLAVQMSQLLATRDPVS